MKEAKMTDGMRGFFSLMAGLAVAGLVSYVTRRGTEMLDEAGELMDQGKEACRAAGEKLAHAAL
jgi:hypothetical protein